MKKVKVFDELKQSLVDAIAFERRLTPAELQTIRTKVQEGVRDLEEGRYEEFDEAGLRAYFAALTQKRRRRK